MGVDLQSLSTAQLLELHSQVSNELRSRGISRTSNNPTGDLAEYLFCQAFDWIQEENSMAAIDAVGRDGTRYQIKGRRLTRFNKSRQLSAIRNLNGSHFDYLAAALFNEDYTIRKAALIPAGVVQSRAKYIEHTNSHKFMLQDDVWTVTGVRDVTLELQRASKSIDAGQVASQNSSVGR